MRVLLLLAAALLAAGCEQGPPTVHAGGETLVGKYVEDGRVTAFLGVPFAEPPVGELRWQAPKPLASHLDRRDVTEFAPACIQTMRILDWYRGMAELFGATADYYDDLEISEDCLYLNIWTTTLRKDAMLPVMVWIHGGSNKSGWSYELNYHGHKLAQENVVVVSVAYRQGVFGFLSHEDMNAEDGFANFAYWDLIAALEWIQQHITAFGGDPDRVTLFGESAGAQNIVALMFMERAQGLFHRAIAQSTPRMGIDGAATLNDERERATVLAQNLGIEPGNLDALRAVDAASVLAAYDEDFSGYYHDVAVDNQLVSRSVWDSLSAGVNPGIPLLIGTNDHESYASMPDDMTWDSLTERVTAAELPYADRALSIVADEENPRRAADRLFTANQYLCKSLHLAADLNAAGSDAWGYHFTRVREDPAGESLGAYHGAEYPYVFGTHDAYMTTNATDLALEEIMQRYWVNFAATGDPNGPGAPEWPKHTWDSGKVQELGDSVFAKPAQEPELCALFEQRDAKN